MYRLFFSLGVLYAKRIANDTITNSKKASKELDNIHSLLETNENVMYVAADDDSELIAKLLPMGFSVAQINVV